MGYRVMIPDKVNKKILKFDRNTRKLLYNYIKKNLKDTDNPKLYGKALNEVFPEKYFAIENLAVDGIIIISNEEGKIYSIQYDKKELICNSLSEYLDICLKRN